jgi:hypothetical protein
MALGAADILIPVSFSPEMKLDTLDLDLCNQAGRHSKPHILPLFGAAGILSSGVLEVMWKTCA